MNHGIIQNAIENKSVINGVELRDVSDPEMKFESEQPTLADLIVPGTGRSISTELEYLLSVICAGGKFS